jgi:hypothetical protein
MVYTLTVHLYANEKPDSIERIKAKLIEAARIYRKDKETIDCMDSILFCFFERAGILIMCRITYLCMLTEDSED